MKVLQPIVVWLRRLLAWPESPDRVVCVNERVRDKADRKRSQKARQVLLWKAFFACKDYRQVERVTHADKMVARGQMTEHERTQRRWWAMSFGLPSVKGRSTYLFETDVIKWLSEPPRWKGKAASDVR